MDAIAVAQSGLQKAIELVANPLAKGSLEKNSATFQLKAIWAEEFESWALTWLRALAEQGQRLDK